MNLEDLLGTLESPIVIRPTRRMTQGELESYRAMGYRIAAPDERPLL
jgi:hypothetical protein